MEDTLLELLEVCHQKEFYCMHNNVNDLIESAINSKILSINLKSQRLDKKKQEVKNIVEQPTTRGTHIAKSLQKIRVKKSSTSLNNTFQISSVHAIAPVLPTKEPEYSLSMGYEHLNTISKTESDEVIESSAKNLLPIPSEYEVTSDDESECETPPTSTIPVEDNDSLREEIDIFTSTDDLLHPGIKSDDYDLEVDIHFLEELLVDDDSSFPRPPSEPPDVEFFFDFEPNSEEMILDELNEDECFDPRGEINYFSFIFVIQSFLPYLIFPEVFPLLLSVGSEDTIFDPEISTYSRWHLIGMELSCALMFIQTLMKARLRFSFPFALPMDK
nr:hypothetical protein [Tanacetum cinerariifolium]